MSPTRVPLILGAMGFGVPGNHPAPFSDLAICQKVIDIFTQAHGQKYIDTARVYTGGTSEEYLSKCDTHAAEGEAVIDTKVHPSRGAGDLGPESIRKSLLESIKALGGHKIRVFYLHAPDRNTPLEVTAEAINDLHKEGLFEEFGMSNYTAFEVAQMWTICKERSYVLPTVYQGAYNILQRGAETELFHALRKYNIRFAVWSPLAGGILTGKLKNKDEPEKGSRFDSNTAFGRIFRNHFLSGTEMDAYQYLEGIILKHNLTPTEVALRWLQHHSALTPNDFVILGGSKLEQIESNCIDSAKGPLPDEVVEATETAWLMAKARAPTPFLRFN